MRIKHFLKPVLLVVLILVFVLPNFQSSVRGEENLEEICQLEKLEESEKNLSIEEYQATLEECLEYYEKKSSQYEENIKETQQTGKTLQNEIYILKQKIAKLDTQIYQSNLMVKDLGFQILDSEVSVEKTSFKIEDSKEKLAAILRTVYEEQQKSLIEILLSEEELSNFFDNLVALEVLNNKNKELILQIKDLKSYLEEQKQSLEEEKSGVENLLTIQTLQKKEQQDTKKEQEYFLKLNETEYQKYLREKETAQKQVTEIRARIFELIGVPEAPTFGEAYEIAKYVETITGVRPALLLAVLTQESNIGKNVGQCYLKDPKTGSGVYISTGKTVNNVMKPMGLSGRKGDVDDFLKITKELGLDYKTTPVSCPILSVGGYGGAMGPAQFIPTTWVRYQGRLQTIIGKPADPWVIKDAFLAAALYLSDYGAKEQTYNSEWKAAMIYFSGTTNTRYRFYGDSVVSLAAKYQKDIEVIEAAK